MMDDKELDKCKEAYRRITYIRSMPAKAIDDDAREALVDDIAFLCSVQKDFYETLVLKDITVLNAGNFELDDTYTYWSRVLDEQKEDLTPPKISNDDMNSIINGLERIYAAKTLINGAITELGPLVSKWRKKIKRCEAIAKGLALTDKEWQGESAFYMFFSERTLNQFQEFEELLETFEKKQTTFNEAYEVLSRLVTLNIESPEKDGAQYRTDKGPKNVGSVSGGTPGWLK